MPEKCNPPKVGTRNINDFHEFNLWPRAGYTSFKADSRNSSPSLVRKCVCLKGELWSRRICVQGGFSETDGELEAGQRTRIRDGGFAGEVLCSRGRRAKVCAHLVPVMLTLQTVRVSL